MVILQIVVILVCSFFCCLMNIKKKHLLFIHLFLAMLGLCCCTGFSLGVTSRRYSLAVVRGLLIMVVSLVAEHRLQSAQASVVVAPGLWNTGSVVVVHRFSCFTVCGILSDQGSNPCPLHCQVHSLPLSYWRNLILVCS